MTERNFNFIVVREQVVADGRKPTYAVFNRAKDIAGMDDAVMGVLMWFAPFKQNCYIPCGPGVLTGSYMEEIVQAIKLIAAGKL